LFSSSSGRIKRGFRTIAVRPYNRLT
jgi:hypothetical protein